MPPLPSRVGPPTPGLLIALVIGSTFFLEEIDATMLATALPSMARDFHVDPLRMSSVLTAYLVCLAVFLPASTRIADRFGSRTVFAAAIVLFTAASLASTFAPTLNALILCRAVQGIGGALMNPVGRMILMRSVPKSGLLRAMSWMLVPATIAPMLGPPLGGLVVSLLSWRWVFYLNLPAGLVALGLTMRLIPQLREIEPSRFDLRGAALSGAALACLIFGLESAARSNGGAGFPASGLWLLAAGVVACLLYAVHARRTATPILDFRLMRVATFRLSLTGGTMTRLAIGAQPFLLPTMLQVGFGLDALHSGLVTFSAAIGSLFMRAIGRRLLARFGYRTTLVANSLGASLTFAGCAAFRPDWPLWLLSGLLVLGGLSQSLQFLALNSIAYADIEPARMSAANALYTTMQRFGITLGVCVGAGALAVATHALGEVQPHPQAFSIAFLVVGLLSALALPAMLKLAPDAGESLREARSAPKD